MVAGILARAGDRSMRAFPRRTSRPHLSRRRRHHADLAHPWMRCPKYGSGPRKCKRPKSLGAWGFARAGKTFSPYFRALLRRWAVPASTS